jgi:uncharacterized glyoxalase superfamily protein PhnB
MTDNPTTAPQVVPNFWVDAVEPVRDFYMEKLGFEHMMGVVGKDGKLDFGIVIRDGNMVMLGRPMERIEGTAPKYPTARPVDVYVYVKDVDAYHGEVKGRSVPITEPLTTQWWGDRNFAVKDPYGYTIWFCQTVGPLAPPPGVTMV